MYDTTRKILERPFAPEQLKQRQGASGKTYTYLEIQLYIDRLNEAFHGIWSWEVIRRDIIDDQLIVEGRLSAGGIMKTGIGGASVTRRRDGGSPISLADDVKKGEADALKRACRLLGVGRELYAGDDDEVVVPQVPTRSAPVVVAPAPPQRTAAPPERSRLTSKQLNAIWAIARNQGYSDAEFQSYCVENFGVQPSYLSRAFASQIIETLGNRTNGHAERRPGEEG